MATLTVLGAARGVTGSCYLLRTPRSRVLLECGLVQGHREEEGVNAEPFPFDVDALDAVVLSHGHLDHSGRLPRLVGAGYAKPVYMTDPTTDLVGVLLKDAASLARRDAEWENKRLKRAGKPEIEPTLRYTSSTEESIALNRIERGAIIVAGSGMCNGGRIRHHLRNNLWKRDAHVVIVGYQANGTPGRRLVDGATHLVIGGEEIAVKAKIHTLGGFSAHAGQSQLLDWAGHFHDAAPRLCLIHGDPDAKRELRRRLGERGIVAEIPEHGDVLSF